MHIGIDFDNTIACYDMLFYREAVARQLIPANTGQTKNCVRDYLREAGREDEWTELQGFAYGEGIGGASLFSGVKEFFATMHQRGAPLSIISHKTSAPVMGPKYNLHEAARRWLLENELIDESQFGLSHDRVFFNETKSEKLSCIGQLSCTHFIDDLPEFLSERDFPPGVERILFDPHERWPSTDLYRSASSWSEILAMFERGVT